MYFFNDMYSLSLSRIESRERKGFVLLVIILLPLLLRSYSKSS